MRTFIAKQHLGLAAARDIQVRPAVVVVVAARDRLDEGQRVQADLRRTLGERAVAVIAEQFAPVGVAGRCFVADEQVQPAVIVVIKPGRRLCRMKAQQAGLLGHIVKRAVAVVAQQR